jgi:DNA-binding winged helix-turn-helix (wHTH) protein/TolB-like protein/Tfp pilus assembly protein PilF
MNTAPEDRRNAEFLLGDWLVSPSLNQLSRGGTTARVRPKVMDVLVVLAAHPGEVVAKAVILDAVWAKKFLADSALSRAVCELRETLGDEAHGSTYIETIAKRGYRLIAPVRLVPPGAGADAPVEQRLVGPKPPQRSAASSVWPALATSLVLLAPLASGHGARPPQTGSTPAAKRILVLPFDNLGAPDDDYLAVGVSDEIAGRLTKAKGLAVLSSPRRVAPASAATDAGEIGHHAGADYVLAGTLQWDTDGQRPSRVKITPRLVRVADRVQLWAEVYHYKMEDTFRVQSEIAGNVITEIGIALTDRQRLALEERPTSSIEAWQAFTRGVHYMRLPDQSGSDVRLALQMYERAVALDPSFALAHAGIGQASSLLYHYGLRTVEDHRVRAREAFDRALALDPGNPDVHLLHALYLYWCHRAYDGALSEVAVARRARPDSPYPWEVAGLILRRRGDWRASADAFARAARLLPGDALNAHHAGATLSLMRRYDEAALWLDRAISALPDEPMSYGVKAENLRRRSGALDDARAVLEAAPAANARPLARAWFWQEVYEGRYEDAIRRLAALGDVTIGVDDLQQPKELLLALAERLSGDEAAAKESCRAALVTLDRALRGAPDNPYLRAYRGIALAGLGRSSEALREGARAVAACPIAADAVDATEVLEAVAELYVIAGAPDQALDCLDQVLSVPAALSVELLRIDPRWAPLRSQPSFHMLLDKHSTPSHAAA